VVRANAQAGLENVALWHERDISHSSVEKKICERLGLVPAPVSSQVIQRDRHAFYLSTLAVCAA